MLWLCGEGLNAEAPGAKLDKPPMRGQTSCPAPWENRTLNSCRAASCLSDSLLRAEFRGDSTTFSVRCWFPRSVPGVFDGIKLNQCVFGGWGSDDELSKKIPQATSGNGWGWGGCDVEEVRRVGGRWGPGTLAGQPLWGWKERAGIPRGGPTRFVGWASNVIPKQSW